jgi:putative nucleotidyltransferase with HDIG domain
MSLQPEKLILIIDADSEWAIHISGFLLKADYKTALSFNCNQALEMIEQLHPHLIVFDIDHQDASKNMIFDVVLKNVPTIPILITTAVYNLESFEISQLLQKGIFDCISKPYSAEILLRKIELAITNSAAAHPIIPLNDFSSFFNRIKQLNASQNLETLLDVSFDYFVLVTQADNAALYLLNREKHAWQMAREKKEFSGFPNETNIQEIIRAITLSEQPILEKKRVAKPGVKKPSGDTSADSSILALPLIAGNEPFGMVILQRLSSAPPFLPADLQAAEIIATQVGSVFVNINLHETLNQKLFELQIVSSYSEKLMRMVDKYEVIKSLCETAVRQVNADFAGFFIVQRRAHEFLYWSRYTVSQKMLQDFSNETIAIYNRSAASTLRARRITYTMLKIDNEDTTLSPLPPLTFRHAVPLCWDDLKFGAAIFGAVKEPDRVSGKLALLSSIIVQTHIALTNTKLYSDMKENYIRTIKALAIAVDAKDTYTHGHSENVMNIAEEIARELSIDETTVGSIRDAGLLHDIGKIGIPGYILNKPGPLTYEEFNGIMKTHSTLGANIVRDVPFLRDLYRLILYHHEHYNGKGYPEGLKGEQIPLGARILHVADAFEAMTSDRPYRMSLGKSEAVNRLNEESGKQFDPAIIAAFLQVAKRKNWLADTRVDQKFPFTH